MQQTVNVSIRVRPSALKDHHDTDARMSIGCAWARHVVVGSDQEASFEALGSELMSRLRAGFSCTLLAYGQTGSGKTYTMFGPSGCLTESALVEAGEGGVPSPWGLFPRVALELLRDSGGMLHACAVEVYNNEAYDLLDDRKQLRISGGRKTDVAAVYAGRSEGEGGAASGLQGKHPPACTCRLCFKAKEDDKAARVAKRGQLSSSLPSIGTKDVAIKKQLGKKNKEEFSFATVGETMWPLVVPSDVAKLARHVETSRSAHGHKLNDRSSRSHCLVRLEIASRGERGGGSGGGVLIRKQFLFVDLAGSERTRKSGVQGQRLAEATQINSSLTVLGRVIRGLGASGGSVHLPYRDSALTQLLRSSFEPGSKPGSYTSVVVNVASEPEHREETACSLQFGKRMTAVRNVATKVAGTDSSQERARVEVLVELMRAQLASMESTGAGGGFAQDAPRHEKAMLEENMRRHRKARMRCDRLRIEVTEAESGSAFRAQLERHLMEAKIQEESIGAVLGRQMTIKRLWKEPSAHYLATQAELHELTQQLPLFD